MTEAMAWQDWMTKAEKRKFATLGKNKARAADEFRKWRLIFKSRAEAREKKAAKQPTTRQATPARKPSKE